MRILLTAIVLFGFIPSLAHAACSNPAGDAGKVIYNADHNVVQFCDGTNWIGMSGGGGSCRQNCKTGSVSNIQIFYRE